MKHAKLLHWVCTMHGTQVRKGGELYICHLLRVGIEAEEAGVYLGFEKGICHDLLEDTSANTDDMKEMLTRIGYTRKESSEIIGTTLELTDMYTKESYPDLNRKQRKELECARLCQISDEAQTIKYIDLIDNTKSIVEVDQNFAKVYLIEKASILKGMTAGDAELYKKAVQSMKDGNIKLRSQEIMDEFNKSMDEQILREESERKRMEEVSRMQERSQVSRITLPPIYRK